MKEVQVLAFCDNAIAHDEAKVPAVSERTMSLDGGVEVVLDLCGTCEGGVWQTLLDLYGLGTKATGKAKRKTARKQVVPAAPVVGHVTSATTCPRCGHDAPSRSALGSHTRAVHGIGLVELRREMAEAQ